MKFVVAFLFATVFCFATTEDPAGKQTLLINRTLLLQCGRKNNRSLANISSASSELCCGVEFILQLKEYVLLAKHGRRHEKSSGDMLPGQQDSVHHVSGIPEHGDSKGLGWGDNNGNGEGPDMQGIATSGENGIRKVNRKLRDNLEHAKNNSHFG